MLHLRTFGGISVQIDGILGAVRPSKERRWLRSRIRSGIRSEESQDSIGSR
jgi:hypothetical protein